jgi:sulfatase modifying factor 1
MKIRTYIVLSLAMISSLLLVGGMSGHGTSERIKTSAVPDGMVRVEGGTFMMGSSEISDEVYSNESPAHRVTLGDFYMSKYEVTQALWSKVMGNNPSHFRGNDNLPVDNVSWYDCIRFCNAYSRMMGYKECYHIRDSVDENKLESSVVTIVNGGRGGFRLPTEAEWEYAARGGKMESKYKYAGSNSLKKVAWYHDISDNKTHLVGEKKPNILGLYDMSGNVWEWCWDHYGPYSPDSKPNPRYSVPFFRVLRGGGWQSSEHECRVLSRIYGANYGGFNIADLGVRVVFVGEN